MTEFMGHSTAYWIELQKRLENETPIDTDKLIEEIVQLRGKVSFYESRVMEMFRIKNRDVC